MCGLAGYAVMNEKKAKGNERMIKQTANNLFLQCQERGDHASGFAALTNSGELAYSKQPLPAKEFVTRLPYKKLMANKELPKFFTAHTRFRTSGTLDNRDNHPFVVNDGGRTLALMHNGHIWNYSYLKHKFQLKTGGGCDSEVIAHLLSRNVGADSGFESAIRKTAKILSGEFACSLLSPQSHSLFLWRSEAPLALAFVPTLGTVFYASEAEYLYRATHKKQKELGFFETHASRFGEVHIKELPDDSGVALKSGKPIKSFKLPEQYEYYTSRNYAA